MYHAGLGYKSIGEFWAACYSIQAHLHPGGDSPSHPEGEQSHQAAIPGSPSGGGCIFDPETLLLRFCRSLNIPCQPQPLQQADDTVAGIYLPPLQPVRCAALETVVIVVPPIPKHQERYQPIVPAVVAGLIVPRAPHMNCRIHQPAAQQSTGTVRGEPWLKSNKIHQQMNQALDQSDCTSATSTGRSIPAGEPHAVGMCSYHATSSHRKNSSRQGIVGMSMSMVGLCLDAACQGWHREPQHTDMARGLMHMHQSLPGGTPTHAALSGSAGTAVQHSCTAGTHSPGHVHGEQHPDDKTPHQVGHAAQQQEESSLAHHMVHVGVPQPAVELG